MAGAAGVVGVGLVGGVGGDLVVGLAGWGEANGRRWLRLERRGRSSGCWGKGQWRTACLSSLGGWLSWVTGSYYRSGCITAFFRVFVIQGRRAINATPTLCHALGQGLKEVGPFQAHFADAPVETNLAQAEAIVVLFHFREASLQGDAFASIRFFD